MEQQEFRLLAVGDIIRMDRREGVDLEGRPYFAFYKVHWREQSVGPHLNILFLLLAATHLPAGTADDWRKRMIIESPETELISRVTHVTLLDYIEAREAARREYKAKINATATNTGGSVTYTTST